ncbi:MAG: cytidine deaminase [Prevotella sp.]|nr:cytidine deaminase [Prevotella sp.]
MKELKIEVNIKYFQLKELEAEDLELIAEAIKATDHSYAKYSHFHVGAALRLEDDSIVIGANQENAAYPSGLCAERSAIFAAQSVHPELRPKVLAIAARNEKGLTATPVTPCGACRQVILEMEDRYQKPVKILLYGTDGVYVVGSVKDLLPLSFVDANMH